jgi:hypothetical protein
VARRVQQIVKRLLDVVLAALLLVVLSPLMLTIALLIRLTSGAPVLYAWHVVGQGGRPFIGYKFRTMVVDADRRKRELLDRNEMSGGPVFKLKDDPRITPIGVFAQVLARRVAATVECPQRRYELGGTASAACERVCTVRRMAKAQTDGETGNDVLVASARQTQRLARVAPA